MTESLVNEYTDMIQSEDCTCEPAGEVPKQVMTLPAHVDICFLV